MEIRLSLTKAQYKALISLASWGMYLRTAYRLDPQDRRYPHGEEVMNEILKHFESYALVDWVKVEKGQVLLDELKEMELYETVQEYDELFFWNSLAERLALRDIEEKYDDEDILSMSIVEELNEQDEIERSYLDEFEEHGLENFRLASK